MTALCTHASWGCLISAGRCRCKCLPAKTAASVTCWAQVSAEVLDAFLHLFARGAINGEDDWEALDIGPRWEVPSTVSKTLLTTARLSGVLREMLDIVQRCGIGADRFSVVQVPRELFASAVRTLQKLAKHIAAAAGIPLHCTICWTLTNSVCRATDHAHSSWRIR